MRAKRAVQTPERKPEQDSADRARKKLRQKRASIKRDDTLCQSPTKMLKPNNPPETREQVLTEKNELISRQKHNNSINSAEYAMKECTRWERCHKYAVAGELRECHILYTKQMLDKANAKWARSCENIDDCEALASLSMWLHYYVCSRKKGKNNSFQKRKAFWLRVKQPTVARYRLIHLTRGFWRDWSNRGSFVQIAVEVGPIAIVLTSIFIRVL